MISQVKDKILRFIFPLWSLSIAGILALITAWDRYFMKWCFIHLSYYLIGLLFISWLITLIQWVEQEKPDFRQLFKNYGGGILVSLLLTFFIFISVESHFRLLSDETNLLAVSKSMTFEKTVENVTQGKWIDFNYYPLEKQLEKRPFLFPFLVHLLHIFFGYRTYHPFVANFLTLFGIFSIIFIMVKERVGFVAACALLFMIAAQPVVTQTATSGAIDLICVFFMILSLFSLESYLRNPSRVQFCLLWVHLLLLANTRYEAPLYLLIVVGILLYVRKIPLDYFKSSVMYALSPLILLPTYWQRIFLKTDLQIPEGEVAFSIERFLKHNLDFLKSLIQFDDFYPYATLINILAVIAMIYFMILFFLNQWPNNNERRLFVLVSSVLFLTYWAVINAHYLNFLLEPAGGRIWSLAALVFSIMAFLFLCRLRFFYSKTWLLLLISIGFFCFYHPVSIESRFSNSLDRTREYRIVMDFLKEQNPRNFLVITYMPGIYAVHNYGAVDFHYANRYKEELLRELQEQHLFSEIFVVQEIERVTSNPNDETKLDAAYPLETIFDVQRNSMATLRVSRIVKTKGLPIQQSVEAKFVIGAEEPQNKIAPINPISNGKKIASTMDRMERYWQVREHYEQGHAAMGKKQLESAIRHYTEAVRLNPEYAEAYNSLAIVYTFSGQFEEAVKNYDEALRLWPDYAEAKRNRKIVAEMVGKPPEEQKQFLESLKYEVGK